MNFVRVLGYCAASFLVAVTVSAQSSTTPPSSYEQQEREYRYQQIQNRMLELSRRMGEISGTEPIEVIDRSQVLVPEPPKTPAQVSFDSLPGPPVEPLPLPEDSTNFGEPVHFESQVNRVARTNQQMRGDYYFLPMFGLAMTSYSTYTFEESNRKFSDKLDGKWGNSIALTGGRRWDNFMTYLRFAYQYQKYENPDFSSGVSGIFAKTNGVEESYSFSFGGGYSVPLIDQLSTIGTLGLGSAWRRDSFDADLYFNDIPIGSYSDFQSSMVLFYDLALGFEYLMAENFSTYFGYRMVGLTSNKDFEGSFQHLFEIGAGANF